MHRFKPDASVINDALESVRWIGASMNRCIGIDKWIAIPHRSIPELDPAEVKIQVNQEFKETFDFDQGTRKYGHIKFGQSICLPPTNSYLVAIQELAARACLLVFCKLLQTFLQTQSLPCRNSWSCVFRTHYKIQCIPKLPEPWLKFKNFCTKANRTSCTGLCKKIRACFNGP